ncbi:MAG: alcohol dehydrogenase catalytic domain-containing protein [Firmicutes bacterium]|nr:alcohol dehydrogenase catalytic domain-containing protein [Bacillota bacterium]
MKALVFRGVNDARVEEVAVPQAGAGEILVKVDSCSVCGTDVRTYRHGHPRIRGPRVIGHEFSGTVAGAGPGVHSFREGDRVMVVPGISCGRCYLCQKGLQNLCENRRIIGFDYDGAFAGYVRIPAEAVEMGNVRAVPERLSLREACLIEPFTAVYNGQALLGITPGVTVCIIGAGPIGVMHALQARARGAGMVVMFEQSAERRKTAAAFAVDRVVDPQVEDPVAVTKVMTGNRGFDVVIVACGVGATQAQALHIAGRGGRVSFFAGLPHGRSEALLDTNLIHYKQLALFGANGSGPNQYDETIRFLAAGIVDVSSLITAQPPLDDVLEGFSMVERAVGLKVVVHPHA